jgi:hypothetical protein
VTGVWPRGRVDGAHNGLGNKGLGKIGRVVKGEEVLVKLLGGTHGWLVVGGRGTTQRASRRPKSGW